VPSLADARPGGKLDASSAARAEPSRERLRVCLFHDYREERQMSMKLYAEQLGEALGRRGMEVERVRPPPVFPRAFLRFTLLDKLDSYTGRFLVYPRLARRARADVFHVIDHGQGYLVRDLDPARTVVTCHDLILLLVAARRVEKEFSPRVATAVLRRAVHAMGGARRIIADSEQTRSDLAEFVGIDPARVTVIYPGLNYPFTPRPELREETRARLGLPPGRLVLQVGQVGFYKNIPGCLRVIQRLRRGGLDVTFVRGGRRMDGAQQALARRLGLEGAVREVGPVSPDDLAALYGACDVLLFPSLYEGFGWPPLEAMASGLPVVCSRAGSLREVVDEAALTAEPEDVGGLAEHVAAVLTDATLAERLRARGVERAAAFDWGKAAEQVLGVYRSVVEA
jgi:glycosyltransferase involved in cell wall biosynthesis